VYSPRVHDRLEYFASSGNHPGAVERRRTPNRRLPRSPWIERRAERPVQRRSRRIGIGMNAVMEKNIVAVVHGAPFGT